MGTTQRNRRRAPASPTEAQLLVFTHLAGCHVVALGRILDGLLHLFGFKLDVCGSTSHSTCLVLLLPLLLP
jgi:hypothetical protein